MGGTSLYVAALSPPPACPPPPGEDEPYPVTPMQIFYNGLDPAQKAFWDDGIYTSHASLIISKLVEFHFNPTVENFAKWSINYMISNPNTSYPYFNSSFFTSEFDYSNIDNPIIVEDNPTIKIPGYKFNSNVIVGPQPLPKKRLLTLKRNPANVEDMQYGILGDESGISPTLLNKSNSDLLENMKTLISNTSIGDLKIVGMMMFEKFKLSQGGIYTDNMLNGYVSDNSNFKDFIIKFGNELNNQLKLNTWSIDAIDITGNWNSNIRPVFNGLYNKFHGLQILLNDTEETNIDLVAFNLNPTTKKWTARINVTIKDHFGLDKADALKFQMYHPGFAAWWILQHKRGFKPFETHVSFTMDLICEPE